jgi:hypothetical protein
MFLEPLAASALFLQVATDGRPGWCRAKHPPSITVNLTIEPMETDFTQGLAQLKTMPIDTKSPYGAHVETLVGGLTSGQIEVKQRIALGGVQYGSRFCTWYDSVVVDIRLDPKVMVAREYPRGTCRFNAIWTHEQKHVKVDNDIVRRYRPMYEQAISQQMLQLGTQGPVPAGADGSMLQNKLTQDMQDAIARLTQKMDIERQSMQQAIDSREEYDAVGRQCGALSPPPRR